MDQHQRIDQILSDLAALPVDQRESFAKSACGDDRNLWEEISKHLQNAHQETQDFELNEEASTVLPAQTTPIGLGAPAADITESTVDFDAQETASHDSANHRHDPIDAPPASRIGKYEIIKSIGQGGMGQVYLAEQQEPVKRQVALKVIKTDTPSKEIIARFEAERQALAMMDHPNIARVLDAGLTEQGRPFFAMELVQGTPIHDFCDGEQYTIRQRLVVFLQACRAIQHAHQKGIIHRDIKPSNVFVGAYDNEPVCKVIDFGLAKAFQDTTSLTDHTLQTHYGQVLGTLEYMSPEQADLTLLDVDTQSDVYSLGVVLYELMCGITPLGGDRLRGQPFDEILRRIREEDPQRPSARLGDLDQAEKIASARSTDARGLRSLIRGDLDIIALKSLEKDRIHRYESPAALANDVERFLNREPILARPPNISYRLTRAAQKHRVGVSIAAVALAGLLISGVLGWQIIAKRRTDQFRASIVDLIDTGQWRLLPRIEVMIEQLDDPASRNELNRRIQEGVQSQISLLVGSEDWFGRRDEIASLLKIVENQAYKSSIEGQLSNAGRSAVNQLLTTTGWQEQPARVTELLNYLDDDGFQRDSQRKLEQELVSSIVFPKDVVDADQQDDHLNRTRMLVQIFPASTLLTDYVKASEIQRLAADNLFTHTQAISEQVRLIKNSLVLNRIRDWIDANSSAAARRFLANAADGGKSRTELKSHIAQLADALPDSSIASLLNKEEFFPNHAQISLKPHLENAGFRFAGTDQDKGHWTRPLKAGTILHDLSLGRDFQFSTTLNFKAKTDFYFRLFDARRNIYPLQISVHFPDEGAQDIDLSVYDYSHSVGNHSLAYAPDLQFNVEWTADSYVVLGEKVVQRKRLFEENHHDLRLSLQPFQGVLLSKLQLTGSTVDSEPTSMQLAGQLAIDGKLAAAQRDFEKIANSSDLAATKTAARLRAAVCKLRNNPGDDSHRKALLRIAEHSQPNEAIVAYCELISAELAVDTLVDHDLLLGQLIALPFEIRQLPERVPANFWIQLAEYIARRQRSFELMQSSLEQANLLKDFTERIAPFTTGELLAYMHLCTGQLMIMNGEREQAATELDLALQLANYRSKPAIIVEAVWLAIAKNDKASLRKLVPQLESHLKQPLVISDRANLQLWIARSKWTLDEGGRDEAIALLKQVIDGNSRHPKAEAMLLYGFILEQRGEATEALETWKAGFQFCWKDDALPADLPFVLLGSLSGDLKEQHIRKNFELNLGKGLGQVRLLLFAVSTAVWTDISTGLRNLYREPAGRQLAYRLAMRQADRQELLFSEQPQLNGICAVVQTGAFDKATSEQSVIVRELADSALKLWKEGLPISASASLLFGWIGRDPVGTVQKAPQEFQHRLAYVYAHRLKATLSPADRRQLIQIAAQSSVEPLQHLANEELKAFDAIGDEGDQP